MGSQEKWQLISVIEQILGVFLTFIVGRFALISYMRKCRLHLHNHSGKLSLVASIFFFFGEKLRFKYQTHNMGQIQCVD